MLPGLERKINPHIIGILEKIKFTLLSEDPPMVEKVPASTTSQKYDA